jgi:hypothetical protein
LQSLVTAWTLSLGRIDRRPTLGKLVSGMLLGILLTRPCALLVLLALLPAGLLFELFLFSSAFFLKLAEAATGSAAHKHPSHIAVLAILSVVVRFSKDKSPKKPDETRKEATGQVIASQT